MGDIYSMTDEDFKQEGREDFIASGGDFETILERVAIKVDTFAYFDMGHKKHPYLEGVKEAYRESNALMGFRIGEKVRVNYSGPESERGSEGTVQGPSDHRGCITVKIETGRFKGYAMAYKPVSLDRI